MLLVPVVVPVVGADSRAVQDVQGVQQCQVLSTPFLALRPLAGTAYSGPPIGPVPAMFCSVLAGRSRSSAGNPVPFDKIA